MICNDLCTASVCWTRVATKVAARGALFAAYASDVKAFVSAPAGLPAQAIRRVLTSLGIELIDAASAPGGLGWGSWLRLAVGDADIVLVALPEKEPDPSAFMVEIGVAVGLGKPILVVVPKSRRPPLALAELPYVRADIDDSDAIALNVRAVLGLRERTNEPRRKAPTTVQPELAQWLDTGIASLEHLQITGQAERLESLVAELFRRAGGEVRTAESSGDAEIDMAMMFGPDAPVGGVILIEVKRLRSRRSLIDAVRRLQVAVLERGSELGLLVYWNPNDRVNWIESAPRVISLDLSVLPDRLRTMSLAEVVADERNRAIHEM